MMGVNPTLRRRLCSIRFGLAALIAAEAASPALSAQIASNSAAVARQYSDLGKLPDWSGVWVPDNADQNAQMTTNPPPWNPRIQAIIDFQKKEQAAGRPTLVLWGCFPHGMPSWMLINHNAMEVLFTPGRVTMLGEVDGNRLRRIYTDGRLHPDDPDTTFHGHSIGKWEGDTLVVDTIGIAPQAPLAIHEALGVPNNGDMHITERLHLIEPDVLVDELTITAPKILTKPWTTVRRFTRLRGAQYDIVEGQCIRGDYEEGVDKNGNATFVPAPPRVNGGVVPPKQ
jgi:hypothetical protein